ncbi:Nitrogen assimilation transcription factor nit-4 [Lasiodiplodia hormozganensis]|uniref:Nitrogen assimilation transcription factor nit-4 n=1 Tax=Lasiodiplodia hormozganensis TaxID=869390 RepID=A0AA39YJZ3_9PEZI|nr:Nitrogen assimilation transcription factor nit-4 [Lasiodiplodia hormozganensis]
MARQLLPHSTAPPTLDPPAAPASGQKRKRPNGILAVACLACQKRKQKCDGARPACRSCASKKIACFYDVPEGQTRLAALKSNNAQLQSRVWASGNLLWALKTSPPNDVAQILERIRSSDDPSLILDDFDLEPGALKPPPSRAASAPTSPLHFSSEPAYYPLESISIDNLYPSNEHCLSASVLALLRSPANREALHLFLQCTGLLFHVFSKTQADSVLEEVLSNTDTAIAKTSLCEVCAMAAVAAQYLQGSTAPGTGHHFYNVARQYLDDAIAVDPLRAMKSCALLAMYNIVTKASVALAYVDGWLLL